MEEIEGNEGKELKDGIIVEGEGEGMKRKKMQL